MCDSFDAQLLEFEGEKDHVHMLIAYHPKVSVSKLVNILKGRSSRYLKLKFPYLKKYYWKSALWSSSFFASSCGGAPISVLKEYIRHQKAPT